MLIVITDKVFFFLVDVIKLTLIEQGQRTINKVSLTHCYNFVCSKVITLTITVIFIAGKTTVLYDKRTTRLPLVFYDQLSNNEL
jgi:hypothetical protein